MSALAEELRSRSDADLVRLLRDRPDLGSPAPSSITSLAVRAATRPSVGRAVSALDRYELDVAEALVVLTEAGEATSAPALSAVLGIDAGPGLDRLRDLALVAGPPEQPAPVPALADALGPYPAGLGPSAPGLRGLDGGGLDRVLAAAPPGARRVVDALTWGPPTGEVDPAHLGEGVAWLLGEGLLLRTSATQVVLPREVGLAARAGLLRRGATQRPALPSTAVREAAVVAAESARAASALVREVADLLSLWEREPATDLRAGGVGSRELRRVTAELAVPAGRAALVVELAAMSGLVAPWAGETGEREWLPTAAAQAWLALGTSARWAVLARAWLSSSRMPWLVGGRTERGELLSALSPGLERPWVPSMRRRVLRSLAAWPPGSAPRADQVHELLAWSAPRGTPPRETTGALLDEAAGLGLTGAGALGGAGRALLAAGDDGAAADDPVAAALEADLPPVVGTMVVQGDLTALVPGRPTPRLEELLEGCADVESRGVALTARFSPGSVRRALDAGTDAETLLAGLREHSATPLPQALEYLVRDAARSHARLRVGVATSYLRSADDAALAALLADPRLAHLRLRPLAATVLVSPEPAAHVRDTLRRAGVAALVEGPDGAVVDIDEHRRVRPDPPEPAKPHPAASEGELEALVRRLRAGEAWAADQGAAASSPAQVLDVLRDAAARGSEVRLEVAGPGGTLEQRRLRPLSVEVGRLRALDVARASELTIAVHRIASAARVPRPS